MLCSQQKFWRAHAPRLLNQLGRDLLQLFNISDEGMWVLHIYSSLINILTVTAGGKSWCVIVGSPRIWKASNFWNSLLVHVQIRIFCDMILYYCVSTLQNVFTLSRSACLLCIAVEQSSLFLGCVLPFGLTIVLGYRLWWQGTCIIFIWQMRNLDHGFFIENHNERYIWILTLITMPGNGYQ